MEYTFQLTVITETAAATQLIRQVIITVLVLSLI